jgi:hypothetical protein
MEKTMRTLSKILLPAAWGLGLVLTVGCSSLKTPATSDVAVTNAAVESAVGAGGTQFAPIEMNAARSKLTLANQALARKDYKLAMSLADQSRADAKLAQSKANSAKARAAADALEDDIQVLRAEINRNNQ